MVLAAGTTRTEFAVIDRFRTGEVISFERRPFMRERWIIKSQRETKRDMIAEEANLKSLDIQPRQAGREEVTE